MTKTSAAYVNNTVQSSANYLGWQGVLSAQLNAVLTKTTDTGQITTFNVVPTGSARDYEVFRFSDSLQATAPIFIKVNYATDTTGWTYVTFTVGTTTNGAGTLGGVTTPALNLYGYNPTVAATRYCYASSDGSQLVFFANLQPQATTTGDYPAAIIIERTRDADGTPNAYGFMVYHWKAVAETPAAGTPGLAGVYARSNDINATQPALVYDFGATVPNIANATTLLIGSTAYALPVYGWGTTVMGASKALMLGYAGDFPKETPVALTHYGTSMTFLPLTQCGAYVPFLIGPTSANARGLCPLVRWE